MEVKRFFSTTMQDALRIVREEFGADAVILSNAKVEGGVEIVAALDYEEDFQLAKEIFGILGNNFHKSDLSKLFKNNPHLLKITDGLEERYNLHYAQNQTDFSTKDI